MKETISGDSFDIADKDLIHQWKTVFRYNVGSQVILFDGFGTDYLCLISSLRNSGATLEVVRKIKNPAKPKVSLTVCLAVIKKDNFEWAEQKATEIGATRIIPVLCERSEKKNLNVERLEKISVEASEQSGRGDVPKIENVHELKGLLNSNLLPNSVLALHPEGKTLGEVISLFPSEMAVIIGPEGGFSEAEVKILDSYNISKITLGHNILRAETATVSISSLILL